MSGPVHTYLGKVLLALDMAACSLIWRDSGITISSMCGLALMQPTPPVWAKTLGWVLNHIEKDHTSLAITDDIERAQVALQVLTRKAAP